MKLSLNWISDYIDLSGTPSQEIMLGLTRSTCEVEEVESVFEHLEMVKVAHVLEKKKHPNADKLSLVYVDAGTDKRWLVCGAPNVEVGQLICMAEVGCKIPREGAEPLEIKPAEIRGEKSAGMLCSAKELGFEELFGENKGLFILGQVREDGKEGFDIYLPGLKKITPGMTLAEITGLRDEVLDIDNKSITHRPDLWCHYGFARELSVIFGKKLKKDPLDQAPLKTKKSLGSKTINIEAGAAKAYYGAYCAGAKVKPSPMKIQARLFNIGQRPINNIVDASNYLMFEVGQPNHIFDARNLKTDTISIATVGKKLPVTEFLTLDDETRKLPEGAVLILDGTGKKATPVALGGVMGGKLSGVNDDTEEIFLESATFYRELTRKTLSSVPLRTDSAVRYEKGQDPAKAKPSLSRLVEILRETCPDLEVGPISGDNPDKPLAAKISVPVDFLEKRLGFTVTSKSAEKILTKLGFKVTISETKKGDVLKVTAPTYRSQYDVSIPEDIVEEIGRIHGYDNIEPVAPLYPSVAIPENQSRVLERELKTYLAQAGGFSEVNNYSFANTEDNALFGYEGLKLRNSTFGDKDRLRVSLIPGIIRHAAGNQDRFDSVRLFEFGRVYYRDDSLSKEDTAREEKRLVMLELPDVGKNKAENRDETPLFKAFLKQRDLLQRYFRMFPGDHIRMETLPEFEAGGPADVSHNLRNPIFLHPGCAVRFVGAEGRVLAICGILHPLFERRYDLKRPALTAELYYDQILEEYESVRNNSDYQAPSIYPDSNFELTLVVPDDYSTAEPVRLIDELAIPEIRDIRLLVVYRGESLEEGKKSISYRIRCGNAGGTMEGERVNEIMNLAIVKLENNGIPIKK